MPDYSLAELSALTGLSARTIRFYVVQGLVPAPGREGRATRYPESTLARLRLVCALRDAHQPLAEVRRWLQDLSDDEILELAAEPPEPAPAPGSALDFIRGLLGEQPGGEPAQAGVAEQMGIYDLDLSAAGPHPAVGPPPADLLTVPSLRRGGLSGRIPAAPPAPRPTLSVGDRSQWERIVIGPDIELHVRRPLSKPANRTVERLIAFARQLQGEHER
jgi:DNA-binding transcriptional MerR regulator